jgi:hypothetical protein
VRVGRQVVLDFSPARLRKEAIHVGMQIRFRNRSFLRVRHFTTFN